ncbi:acyltransferase [Streptomyces sp. NPDC053499]|uniref:acyltransferase n=1 Tax=Streptomyces sp. NPDC053499 TaxID=3365707 RepID=UPI0037D2BB90
MVFGSSYARSGTRGLARRIADATPPDRDRGADALRALAIGGVVLGHWLVTGLVDDGGALHDASPLEFLPQLAPVSWLLQTLAVFFLVGGQLAAKGWASARVRGAGYREWVGARLVRLVRPVAALLGVWTVVIGVMVGCGVDGATVRTLVKLVVSPLWFLAVYAVLTAATPLVARLHPLWPLAIVVHVDLVRLGLGGPQWLGWVNLGAGWLVPYCLGTAWARGELRDRMTGWVLLVGGAGATGLLVAGGGYPASMVGVPGAALSNLNPPSLAAVTFGLAQCGGALLLHGRLRRWCARPGAWAAVALVNLSAMTVFLWHQTAMMAVTLAGTWAGGPLQGLHTVPDGAGWVPARLLWLPVFGVALLVCWAAFHPCERGRRKGASRVVRRAPTARSETAERI